MHRCNLAIASALLCATSVLPVEAQTTPDQTTRARQESIERGLTRSTGATESALVKAAPVLSLQGTRDDKIVRGQIAVKVGAFTFTAGAKASVSETADAPIILADLDGLRNKNTGDVNALWSRWTGADTDPFSLYEPACTAFEKATGRKTTDYTCDKESMKKDGSPAALIALKAMQDLQDNAGTIFFAGGGGSLSPETFRFVGADDLRSRPDQKHASWSANAIAGVVLSTNTTLTGSYKRQIAYRAGKKVQTCSPFNSAGTLTCTDNIVGAPTAGKSTILSVEIRRFIATSFAIAPKLNRDLTKNVTGVELPIYVLQDKNGGLTGGVILGWRSDTRAFTASAFIGPVLKLINAKG